MIVRYWYSWRGHKKEYEDVEEDDSLTEEELEEMAQNNAQEKCEANGWFEILKGDKIEDGQ